jgi:hypothetical protein
MATLSGQHTPRVRKVPEDARQQIVEIVRHSTRQKS